MFVQYARGNKLPEQALSIIVGRVLVGLVYLHRVRYMIHRQGDKEGGVHVSRVSRVCVSLDFLVSALET